MFLWSYRMYIEIKVGCKTWNQGLSHSWNVLKPHWGIPTCQRHEMYNILFTLCVNISISLSTEYLHRLYVICSWDKSSWCDLQIRKKILKQQLLFGNTLCLFVAFRRSAIAIYRINFTVRRHKTKSYGDRPFSICAPKLWNDLPLHLRNCASFKCF